ncbi:MAG: YgfZ/GcvT domain-containing protein [Opitutaceae bacterium]
MELVFGYEYTTRTHLLVSDEDAADFLQSQFTNELRPFDAGRCTYGLWLDVKGKVLGDSTVLCEGDELFRLISETSEADVLVEKLEKHIIADDVEIERVDAATGFALIGEGAVTVLSELGLEAPAVGGYTSKGDLRVFAGRRSKDLNFELLCLSAASVVAVREVLAAEQVKLVTHERVTADRLEAGYPLVPIEVGPTDLPGEGGLERDAVSFTKGCYLGQEVVARMHNVGRPQRALFVLKGAGAVPSCPTAIYNRETKQVGELRTAISVENGWQGVALLKHRYASVGDVLITEGVDVSVERYFRAPKGAGNE